MRAMIGRILNPLPTLFTAAGFVLFMITNQELAPHSLDDALGHLAFFYVLGVVLACTAAGVLSFFDNHKRLACAEVIMRLVTATLLGGFAIGVIGGPEPNWILAGLSVAATADHMLRWWQLRTVILPALVIREHLT